MAENEEVITYEEVVDGYEETTDSGGNKTIAVNDSKITLAAFDLNYALSGGILYAEKEVTENNQTVTKCYIATEFDDKSGDRRYPYRAKVEGKLYNFDNSGRTSMGLYQLKTTTATSIVTPGTTSGGATVPEDGRPSSQGASRGVSLKTLNFREQVAAQALNAMIGHLPDPLSYPSSNITLLVKKAFEFSIEFMNQAFSMRKENADFDPTTGEEVAVDDSPEMIVLKDIKNAFYQTEGQTQVSLFTKLNELTNIKNSMMRGTGSNQVTMLDVLEDMKDAQEGIEAAVSRGGSNGATVLDVLEDINDSIGTVATKVEDGDADIVTAIGGVQVSVNTQDIADGIDASSEVVSIREHLNYIDGYLDSGNIASDLSDIKTTVESIDDKIPNPGSGA